MCDKAADNYVQVLEFVPGCYKTQTICNKAVNTYPYTIPFVHDCYKTREMRNKAVILVLLYFNLFPIYLRPKKC